MIFCLWPTSHAGIDTSDGNPFFIRGARDPNTTQRIATGGVTKLLIGGSLAQGKANTQDDFVHVQGRREHALKKIFCLDLSDVGLDRATHAQHRRWVVGCGVVVGKRPTQGSLEPHLRVCNHGGEFGQGRQMLENEGRLGDLVVGAQTANFNEPIVQLDVMQIRDRRQIDQRRWRRQALLHGWNQSHPARNDFGVFIVMKQLQGLCDGMGFYEFECVHG